MAGSHLLPPLHDVRHRVSAGEVDVAVEDDVVPGVGRHVAGVRGRAREAAD